MRLFAIVVLLVSMVIDTLIALPYLLLSFGSGLLVSASATIATAYSLSALLELVAVILLVSKKQGKLLFSIAVALICLVIFNYVNQPHAGRNFIAIAGAITILGSMFSAGIVRLNPGETRANIRKAQLLYAVIPTMLLLIAPLIVFSSEIVTAVRKEHEKSAHNESLKQTQAAYSVNLLERYYSSASGHIKGETHTLPIKDSLTIYNSYEKELTVHLFPTIISREKKQAILGGKSPFFILDSKDSPDKENWPTYPYATLRIQLDKPGLFTTDNIVHFNISAQSVDKPGESRSSSTSHVANELSTFIKDTKGESERLTLIAQSDNRYLKLTLSLDDKIHFY